MPLFSLTISTMEYYSAIKNGINVICKKMDGTGDHHFEKANLSPVLTDL
jgi:hypothetical protein